MNRGSRFETDVSPYRRHKCPRRRSRRAGGRLEAHIYIGLADLGGAEQALRQVKVGFEESGLPVKAALAGLELGAVWLRQDRLDDATKVVLECTSVLLSLRAHRQAVATVLLLHEASKRRHLTPALLNAVIADLRKLERAPSAPLQPAAEG
jgi:hypothetical protein